MSSPKQSAESAVSPVSGPAGRPSFRAAVVLGVGLGAFFDGIVFHQLLQFHHMLSAYPDPAVATDLPLNVFWDGLFHVLAYVLTLVGVVSVWRTTRRGDVSRRSLLGGAIAGWGLFNVVEGVTSHFLLDIHHVWPDGPGGVLVWDVAFLVWGGVFLGLGYLVARR